MVIAVEVFLPLLDIVLPNKYPLGRRLSHVSLRWQCTLAALGNEGEPQGYFRRSEPKRFARLTIGSVLSRCSALSMRKGHED